VPFGQPVELEFLSGITVRGRLREIFRQEHCNLILSFEDCTVTDRVGRILFDPSWGVYDMAVGARIDSVYGGAADRETFQLYKATPSTSTLRVEHDQQLMALYAEVDLLARSGKPINSSTMQPLIEAMDRYPDEWLLRVEALKLPGGRENIEQLCTQLEAISRRKPDLAELIDMALASAAEAA